MTNVVVLVQDNNVEGTLRRPKKAAATTGLLADIRRHAYHVKPSMRQELKSIRAREAERKRIARGQRQLRESLERRGMTLDDL